MDQLRKGVQENKGFSSLRALGITSPWALECVASVFFRRALRGFSISSDQVFIKTLHDLGC
jgi:hypothetical protein